VPTREEVEEVQGTLNVTYHDPKIKPAVDPTPDLSHVRPLIDRLVQVASNSIDGKFVVAGLGEDPGTDLRLVPEFVHVSNRLSRDAKREALLEAIKRIAQRPGANAYLMPALARADLPDGTKPTEKDIIGVLAVVSDFDAKQEPATRHARLPTDPHAEVETSTGNFQTWIFFDRPYAAADVKPVLVALAAKTGDDCKSVEHLFRVPGCLNWPNKRKREKLARSAIPERATLAVVPEDWHTGNTLAELTAAMLAKWPDVFKAQKASGNQGTGADFDWLQSNGTDWRPFNFGLAHEHLSNPSYAEDRSKGAFHFMKLAIRRGYTPEQLFTSLMEQGAAGAPLMEHYSGTDSGIDEARVRADIMRAFTKQDRPQRTKTSANVFHAVEAEAETGAAGADIRVIQIHGGDLPQVVNEAEAALIEREADIFQRGSMIVRPSLERIEAADRRSDKATRLIPIKLPGMMEQLTACATFQRYSKQSGAWYAVDCPPGVAAAYLERDGLWKLRTLAGVVNCPTLRPDGTIVDQPGYDKATGLLYVPARGAEFPAIPAQPTKEDATAALGRLKSLIGTFPFTNDASRAAALSGMLTALVRRSLPTAPMHAFTAPVAGSGKSKLVDLASMLAIGSLAPVIAQGGSDEETEKRLGSALIAGDAVVSLDNCDEPLQGVLLCQALTQQVLNIRILGQSRNAVVPSNAAIYATGNNLTVAGDMTRRVLMCAIDPAMERPELREFKSDPVEVLRVSRGTHVAAALTILRAFVVAGKPAQTKALGGFEDWSRLVCNALVWLGEADPCVTMDSIRAKDPKREQLAKLIYFWNAVLGGKPVTTKQVIDAARPGAGDMEAKSGLREALEAIAGRFTRGPNTLDPERLGKYLGRHVDQVIDGHAIVRHGKAQHGKQLWRIKQSEEW
jgi:hypothetical protein